VTRFRLGAAVHRDIAAERCSMLREIPGHGSQGRLREGEAMRPTIGCVGGQRVFTRDVLRRVAFIRIAQSVGLTLEEIRAALMSLPNQRTPTKADWERLSGAWRPVLDRRIDSLVKLRDKLSSCIGCGCLSLKACALYNPGDAAQVHGTGPRYLLGDVHRAITKAEHPKRGT
jgi:MerR family redox-sensitive transcriptional activator SoxR